MDEELDSDDEDFDVDIVIWFKAMKFCREHANGKSGVSGFIKCPKCGSKLNYSIASINGHLWGECETENCLSWMQ